MNRQAIRTAVRILTVIGAIPLLLWCSLLLSVMTFRGLGWPFEAGMFDEHRSWQIWHRRSWFGDLYLPALLGNIYAALLVTGSIIWGVVKIWHARNITQLRVTHLFQGAFICAVLLTLWRFEKANYHTGLRMGPRRHTSYVTEMLDPLGFPLGQALIVDHYGMSLPESAPILLGFACACCVLARIAWTSGAWMIVGAGWLFGAAEWLRSALSLEERLAVSAIKLIVVVIVPVGVIAAASEEWSQLCIWQPEIDRVVEKLPKRRINAVSYSVRGYHSRDIYHIDPTMRRLLAVEIWFGLHNYYDSKPQPFFGFGDPERIKSWQHNSHRYELPENAGTIGPLTDRMHRAVKRLEELYTTESLAKEPRKGLAEDVLFYGMHRYVVARDTYEELEPYRAMDESFYRAHR